MTDTAVDETVRTIWVVPTIDSLIEGMSYTRRARTAEDFPVILPRLVPPGESS